jgi:hypothetical protein
MVSRHRWAEEKRIKERGEAAEKFYGLTIINRLFSEQIYHPSTDSKLFFEINSQIAEYLIFNHSFCYDAIGRVQKMWRAAYKKILYSVHAVLLETPRSATQPRYWQTIGTSFAIKGRPNPLLITNAHVVCAPNGTPYDQKRLVLAAIMPESKAGIAGVAIKSIEKNIDIAVFEVSKEAFDIMPAVFAKPVVLEIGTAVASVGFPIPPKPKLRPGGGSLDIIKRLATGYISIHDSKPEFDRETRELKHYEINMLSYPGLSGAPVFDINGFVVGMNRGNILVGGGNVAAYAYAIRGTEIIEYLKRNNIEIEINST